MPEIKTEEVKKARKKNTGDKIVQFQVTALGELFILTESGKICHKKAYDLKGPFKKVKISTL